MRYILVLFYALVCNVLSAETLPQIKVGVLQYGTINWELSHIKSQQLDTQNEVSIDRHSNGKQKCSGHCITK